MSRSARSTTGMARSTAAAFHDVLGSPTPGMAVDTCVVTAASWPPSGHDDRKAVSVEQSCAFSFLGLVNDGSDCEERSNDSIHDELIRSFI
ncbi:hypothetical protein ACP70R_002716 [Stipagrostis hirtigluma subsp. patula]